MFKTTLQNQLSLKQILVIVICISLASNLAWASYNWYLYRHYQQTDLAALRIKYPFIDISRHFIDPTDFIVNLQPLREELRALAEPLPSDSMTIYVEYLNTGANIAINNDTKIWPASLAKLPLAMAVMKKVESGTWQLHNELV